MPPFKVGRQSLCALNLARQPLIPAHFRLTISQSHRQTQLRTQHRDSRRSPQHSRPLPLSRQSWSTPSNVEDKNVLDADITQTEFQPGPGIDELAQKIKILLLRPAIWALVISSGIYVGLAFLEAEQELTAEKPRAPQWSIPKRSSLTPVEVFTQTWDQLNPISKLSYGIIAANSTVHLSSVILPQFWNSLWHMPARNVNYTMFTSMFVHGGLFHFGVNMYVLNNFMKPVGYSRVFEGSPYHTLSFYLSAGVLSGFAQHWAALIPKQKRALPEIFIRGGGASGAIFGVLAVFCMQYPTAGMGIIFVPVYVDAQYVLPAVMLFDLYGMIRGYSFLNLGHAAHLSGAVIGVAYCVFDGKTNIWKPLVRFWKKRLQ